MAHDQSTKGTCDICGQQFRKNSLKRHREYCKNQDYSKNFDSEKTIYYKCDICRMEFNTNPKLKQHSQVHGEKISCNLCEKTILPRSMSRHIKMVHTIYQDENNFMRVLSKKREITCKVCNIVLAKQYNLKRHMQNKHEGYDENIPNRLVFGNNIFVVSEEEKILPENENVINIAHELVDDILKTLFQPNPLNFSCHVCLKAFSKQWIQLKI